MENRWKQVKLEDILNFRRGHDLSKKNMSGDNYPVVGSNGIIGYHNEFIKKSPCVTIGRSGNIGTPYYYNQDCWPHNTTLYIDDFKGNDEKYIFYLLKKLDFKRYAGGSAVPTLNRNHIHPIDVFVTLDVNEQKAIAKVLSDLDEKIETNNKINRKLEEMAQAIFKQWFVDFEFPNEDGKPYKSSGGEMVESELGMIPKGWRQSTLEEVAIMSAGGDKPKCFSKNATEDYDVPIYSNGIDNEGLYGYTDKAKIFEEAITVSARGTIGYVCLRQQPYFPIVRLISLVPHKSIITSKYLYFYLKLINISGTGTTQQQLTVPDFKRTKICIPKYQVIKQFTDMVNDIFRKIEVGKNENMKLAELRDTLLPKLMSGEIRVSID
ncbi:MAG: restriction endonuclease subunit S [Clostridium celatum]|nr:restriction endonuclease subunit S [Clostridium celatum]